ncbi:MAG: hypothetical protein P1V20_28315 [Verrucomicrobiales bacterium]|nr:hypothetical protein [Verrucomicrobiales bacterium]
MIIRSVALLTFALFPLAANCADLYKELDGITWECSFRTVPRFRLTDDNKVETLDSKGKVTRNETRSKQIEDRIIRVQYKDGTLWYLFSDDLKSCLLGNTKKYYPVEFVPGGNNAKVIGHPDCETIEVTDTEFKAGAASGDAFHYRKDVIGSVLSKSRAVLLVRSKDNPEKGWFIDGMHIGVAVRTEDGGKLSVTSRTKLSGYLGRSAQITRVLCRANQENLADIHESHVAQVVSKFYGDKSIELLYGYRDMGLGRGYARSFEKSPHWHSKAYTLANESSPEMPALRFETGTRYASALSDAGRFDEALPVFKEIYPLREDIDPKEDFSLLMSYYDGLAKNSFARKDYPRAVNWFTKYIKVAEENTYTGSHIAALLDIGACRLAAGDTAGAKKAVTEAVAMQAARQKRNPKSTYDTWKLSFACVALDMMDEAKKYGPLFNYKSSIRYTEYAHLLALWNGGETEKARSLADKIATRIETMENIQIRRDVDMMTILISKAIGLNTPDAIAECRTEWSAQAQNLKNRPLENYIFARVLVTAMSKL